jgi:hypothetical protein
VYDDAFNVVTTEGENNSVNGRVETCATVTLSPADTVTFPKTMYYGERIVQQLLCERLPCRGQLFNYQQFR